MTDVPLAPGRRRGSNHVGSTAWVLVGIATYWFASLATAPSISNSRALPLFLGIAMASPSLGVVLVTAGAALSPVIGYLALRYWALPSETWSWWRRIFALPLLVVLGMVLAVPVCGIAMGLVAGSFIPILSPAWSGLLVSATIIATAALFGVVLWGSERLAARLLLGREQADCVGPRLCAAHVVGFAALALAIALPVTAIPVFPGAVAPTAMRWLVGLARLGGAVVHLCLTWRAWRGSAWAPPPTWRAAVIGCVVAFVALFVIGAAARLPSNPDPLRALMWISVYFPAR